MSSPVLAINGLTKVYKRVRALNALVLEVERGQVFGLLGPNGSGKSTTLGIVLGAINATSGNYSWFGEGTHHRLRRRVGAILESPSFYRYMSAEDNLRVVAEIKGAPVAQISKVLERTGLADRESDPYKTYSLGMKQRLAIASALLADPEVLVLDEPTNGLDPQGIAEIRGLITELAQEGRTIILASHLLDEVQRVCTHFAVLRRGSKVFQGSVAELLQSKKRVELDAPDRGALQQALSEIDFAGKVSVGTEYLSVVLPKDKTAAELNAVLCGKGISLSHLNQRHESLEQRFLEILREEGK